MLSLLQHMVFVRMLLAFGFYDYWKLCAASVQQFSVKTSWFGEKWCFFFFGFHERKLLSAISFMRKNSGGWKKHSVKTKTEKFFRHLSYFIWVFFTIQFVNLFAVHDVNLHASHWQTIKNSFHTRLKDSSWFTRYLKTSDLEKENQWKMCLRLWAIFSTFKQTWA